jgi:hypothetical protein
MSIGTRPIAALGYPPSLAGVGNVSSYDPSDFALSRDSSYGEEEVPRTSAPRRPGDVTTDV